VIAQFDRLKLKALEIVETKEVMMAELVYVDNSNVFIEGQRVSAVKNGMALDIRDAIDKKYKIRIFG